MDYSYWEWIGPQDKIAAAVAEREAERAVFYTKVAAIQEATAAWLPEGVAWQDGGCALSQGTIMGGGDEYLTGLVVEPEHEDLMLAHYNPKVWRKGKAKGCGPTYAPHWNRRPGTKIKQQWNDCRAKSLQYRLLEVVGLCNEVIINGNQIVAPVVGGKKQEDDTWRLAYRVPVGDGGAWKPPVQSLYDVQEITHSRFLEVVA